MRRRIEKKEGNELLDLKNLRLSIINTRRLDSLSLSPLRRRPLLLFLSSSYIYLSSSSLGVPTASLYSRAKSTIDRRPMAIVSFALGEALVSLSARAAIKFQPRVQQRAATVYTTSGIIIRDSSCGRRRVDLAGG